MDTLHPTYEIIRVYAGYAICRYDHDSCSPWYLDHVYNGRYIWYHDKIHARGYTYNTAKKHLAALLNGADDCRLMESKIVQNKPAKTLVRRCACLNCLWEGPETNLIRLSDGDDEFNPGEACPICGESENIYDVLDDNGCRVMMEV